MKLAAAFAALALCACQPKANGVHDAPRTPEAAVASPSPSVSPAAASPLYRIRDTGKRCFAAPCPSWAAVDVETKVEREITGIDLSPLSLDPKAAEAARQRVLTGLVTVRGTITTVAKQGPAGDGTVLVVTAIVD